MFADFHASVSFALVLLITANPSDAACRTDSCYTFFYEQLAEGPVRQGSNRPYCQLLTDYRYCLNNISQTCRGDISFHALLTYSSNQRLKYNCSDFPETSQPSVFPGRKCNFLVETLPNPDYRYCSLFGSRHLRNFDGQFSACARQGAYPLFDNIYLAVQITHSVLTSHANALTKVTVIVKECGSCTERKLYEASTDDQKLSAAFVDGTTFGGDSARKAVQLIVHNDSSVEIYVHHIAARVAISRHGPFLAVAVRVPEVVIREHFNDVDQLCMKGCSGGKTITTKEALANPQAFARCHDIRLKTPLRIATERCSRAGLNDAFFDACVFDLMTTGNEMLVDMAVDAQNDIALHYPQYVTHYCTGRTNLSIYDSLAGYEFANCVEPTPVPGGAKALFCRSFLYFCNFYPLLYLIVVVYNCLATNLYFSCLFSLRVYLLCAAALQLAF